MIVANIDNDPDGEDKIVTGSFSGLLRVWSPKGASGGKSGAQALEDLLLEQRLNAPILQLAAGRFSS